MTLHSYPRHELTKGLDVPRNTRMSHTNSYTSDCKAPIILWGHIILIPSNVSWLSSMIQENIRFLRNVFKVSSTDIIQKQPLTLDREDDTPQLIPRISELRQKSPFVIRIESMVNGALGRRHGIVDRHGCELKHYLPEAVYGDCFTSILI